MKRPDRQAPLLRTERLVLRPFAPDDAEALFACCRNPRLGDDAGWQPHTDIEHSRRILREVFLDRPSVWAVEEGATRSLAGSVGLMPDPKRDNPDIMMIGYWLDEGRWGRGYMCEAVRAVVEYAFSVLGLEAVSATCYPHNLRSKRVIERSGFMFEGRLYRAVRDHRGMVFDLLSYCLPADTWRDRTEAGRGVHTL